LFFVLNPINERMTETKEAASKMPDKIKLSKNCIPGPRLHKDLSIALLHSSELIANILIEKRINAAIKNGTPAIHHFSSFCRT